MIWYNNLSWAYTMETITMLVVEFVIAYFAYTKSIHTLFDATFILALFPFTLVAVWLGHQFGIS